MATYDFRDARLRASKLLPYMKRYIMSTVPLETPGIGTLATDCYLRIYYDPAVMEKWSMDECAGVICHEIMHCYLKHAVRCEVKVGKNPDPALAYLWNVAGDSSINYTLRKSSIPLPADGVDGSKMRPRLADTNSTEENYDILLQHCKDNPPQGGQGCGQSGSSSDGQTRPWEAGAPGTQDGKGKDAPYGLGEYEKKRLERIVSKDICDHAKGRGTVPGELLRHAQEVLKPKWDPRREILAEVRYTMNCIKGYGATTWKRPHRRCQPGAVRMPSNIQYVPKPTIVADTSGSMGNDDLSLCLGIIRDVIKALPSQAGVRVITGDTHAASCETIFGSKIPQFTGGGGTDMGAIMEEVSQKYPDSDIIIVCTDGETPWPSKPLPQKCLALITRPCSHWTPPAWIRTVYVHQHAEED